MRNLTTKSWRSLIGSGLTLTLIPLTLFTESPPKAVKTRDGGVIHQATAPIAFTLDSGRKVYAAQKGDYVVYDDGRKAQIVTGAGQGNSHLALVGSRLCNGDEIINTLQGGFLLFAREGVPMAQDFLPSIKEEEHQ